MNWFERVNQTEDEQELESLRPRMPRGRPFGQPEWQKEIAQRSGLESADRTAAKSEREARRSRSLWMEPSPD
jgi:hypothetical protein